MNVLVYGIMLLAIAFFAHVIIWRIRLPKHHTRALLYIFAATLICGILMSLSDYPLAIYMPLPKTLYEYIQLLLLYVSVSLVYISSYSAIEVDSPSLTIVLSIVEAGKNGLSRDQLYEIMTDDYLVKPRIEDLVFGKLVSLENDIHKLTPKGKLVSSIFTLSRALLKAPKGG